MPPLLAGQPLRAGERIAVVGRTGSGRSQLLAALEPARRAGFTPKEVRRPLQDFGGRGSGSATRLTELISAAGLWALRGEPIESLSLGERAAAAIVAVLLEGEGVVAIDGHFDAIDPWRRAALLDAAGDATLVLSTHDLGLAARCDRVGVVRDGVLVAFDSPAAITGGGSGARFEVETGTPGATRALVSGLAVDVEEIPGGLRFEAREGQETAARLLLAGYGTVRSFVVRPPSFAEAVAALV